MKQTMTNDAGQVKIVKSGFSWTTFFFGWFVPLFRGDLKYFLIMLAIDIIAFFAFKFTFLSVFFSIFSLFFPIFFNFFSFFLYLLYFLFSPTSFIIKLIFSFFYNKFYIEELLKQGYKFQNSNNNQ